MQFVGAWQRRKVFVIGKFHIFVRQQENNCEKTHWWLRACHRPLSQRQFLAHCILHCMRNVEANPRRTLTPNTFVRRYVCEAILFFLGLLNMEARKIGWTQSQAGRQQASRMHTPNNQSMKCTTYSAVYGVYVLRSHAISRKRKKKHFTVNYPIQLSSKWVFALTQFNK